MLVVACFLPLAFSYSTELFPVFILIFLGYVTFGNENGSNS
jgi:hypothetical protein